MSYTIYGIKSCSSMKKAFDFFTKEALAYTFFDYKKTAPTTEKLQYWCDTLGWEVVLNKKGTTWRGLADDVKASVTDAASAIAVMQAHTSTIKRPIIEDAAGKAVLIGFDEEKYKLTLL